MNHRYDFIYLFDATDANPNGDPDAGNLPRLDSETGQGLITDVCLKRKIRNFVQTIHPEAQGKDSAPGSRAFDIYVREKAVLNHQHARAYDIHKVKHEKNKLPKALEEAKAVRDWMCSNFFDIRTFGAVMTTEVNCGQVRGPAQIAFSRSVDPIVTSEHAVTRMAVTKAEEAEKQQGDNRTMGRKFTVPYALYRTHGTVNPFLGDQTGFTDEGNDSDLELLFQALEKAFDFDTSAARPAGSMAARCLLVFRHDGTDTDVVQRARQAKLGCASAHTLFDRLKIESFDETPAENGKPPRKFSDYADRIQFDTTGNGDWVQLDDFIKPGESKDLGNGITLIRRI